MWCRPISATACAWPGAPWYVLQVSEDCCHFVLSLKAPEEGLIYELKLFAANTELGASELEVQSKLKPFTALFRCCVPFRDFREFHSMSQDRLFL